MAELTERQRRFAEAYAESRDARAAALLAGYSERRAERLGAELLAQSGVAEAVEAAEARRQALRLRRNEAERERVLEELRGIAFAPGGDGKDSDLKYANKLRALKLLLDEYAPPGTPCPGAEEDEDEDAGGAILLTPVMERGKPPEDWGDAP